MFVVHGLCDDGAAFAGVNGVCWGCFFTVDTFTASRFESYTPQHHLHALAPDHFTKSLSAET
jgi:hypothetical protein